MISLVSCKTKSFFNEEDYKLINLSLKVYKDTVYIFKKDLNEFVVYDSIFLNRKCLLKLDISYFASLHQKKMFYATAKGNCESGKFTYIDSLKMSFPCYLMKNYKVFNEITVEDENYLIREKNNVNEKIIYLDKLKISNNKIIVINDKNFRFENNNKTIYATRKATTKLEINGLFYNQQRNLAFVQINRKRYYYETGEILESHKYCIVYKKTNNEWKFIAFL